MKFRGERLRWDEQGKQTVERVDERVVYGQVQHGWSREQVTECRWLPHELVPLVTRGKVEYVRMGFGAIGDLHGFHLHHAILPE